MRYRSRIDYMLVDSRLDVFSSQYGCKIDATAVFPSVIKRRGTATIVEWLDGTKTKVILSKTDTEKDVYTVFCIALAKKLYGNNSRLKKTIAGAIEEKKG